MRTKHDPALLAALTARGLTYKDAAAYLGGSLNTFYKKVARRRPWRRGEYEKLQAWLGLPRNGEGSRSAKC